MPKALGIPLAHNDPRGVGRRRYYVNRLGISIPQNVIGIVAIAGFAMVAILTLGIPAFWPAWVIPVVGAFLGLYSVSDAKQFLIAGLALLGAKWGLNYVPILGEFAQTFVTQLIGLVAPAMLVVAIKSVYYQLKS